MTIAGLSLSYAWLILGALLLAVEAFGVPGIGFLFGGLAAVIVGILTQIGLFGADNWVAQAGAFFGLSAVMAILLWKKLKSWRTSPSSSNQFSNIIGDHATAGKGGIVKGRTGQASWSGTTMMAALADDAAAERVDEGELVEIIAVRGSKLIVAPVKTSR